LNGLYTTYATNTFTNTASYQAATDTYDPAGNISNRVWLNPSGGVDRIQTLSWDARGRLHSVIERDGTNSGYNWTATYDGLNRRISTTSVLVTNGVAFTASPTTINSYYDPQVEFLELGVNYGSTTEFKLYGPDLNGVYGGLNGIGGFDAVSPILNLFEPVISDFRGNILGVIANSSVSWNPARPTGYGAVPGYLPLPLANGADISLASAWRGRWADITGFYNIGLRPYDPVSGRWLTFDSVWNEMDASGMSYCGGDPINGFDSDGRCIEGAATAADNLIYGTANLANNALCTLSYAVASPFAPDWAYQTYGGNVQNFANTVTGTAQFGYNVAATATYGAISPFAPDFAYNNYGGNVQQFMGQAPALYGGDNQSTAYQIGYGTVTAAATLLGGEEGDAGNLGTVSGPITDSSVITDPARLLPAPVVPEAPVNVLPSSGSTFVVSPGGDIIVVPEGASGPVPNINPSGNTTGFGYTGGSGGPGLDSRVSSVRIMDPTLPAGPSPGYPAGYVNYMNASGQSVNPFTGQTIAPSNPLWHIPLTPP
jgi:RHS repeat-associated protein